MYKKQMGEKSFMGQEWVTEPLVFSKSAKNEQSEQAKPELPLAAPEVRFSISPGCAVEHLWQAGDESTDGKHSVEQMLGPSLVTVDFGRPFPIDGLTSEQFRGTGVVVDAKQGLVITDRMTVRLSCGGNGGCE